MRKMKKRMRVGIINFFMSRPKLYYSENYYTNKLIFIDNVDLKGIRMHTLKTLSLLLYLFFLFSVPPFLSLYLLKWKGMRKRRVVAIL